MVFPNFCALDLAFLIILNWKIYIQIRLFRKSNRKKSSPGFKICLWETLFPYRVKTSASFKTNWNLTLWKSFLSIIYMSMVLNKTTPGIVLVPNSGVAHSGSYPHCFNWWTVSILNRLCLGFHLGTMCVPMTLRDNCYIFVVFCNFFLGQAVRHNVRTVLQLTREKFLWNEIEGCTLCCVL